MYDSKVRHGMPLQTEALWPYSGTIAPLTGWHATPSSSSSSSSSSAGVPGAVSAYAAAPSSRALLPVLPTVCAKAMPPAKVLEGTALAQHLLDGVCDTEPDYLALDVALTSVEMEQLGLYPLCSAYKPAEGRGAPKRTQEVAEICDTLAQARSPLADGIAAEEISRIADNLSSAGSKAQFTQALRELASLSSGLSFLATEWIRARRSSVELADPRVALAACKALLAFLSRVAPDGRLEGIAATPGTASSAPARGEMDDMARFVSTFAADIVAGIGQLPHPERLHALPLIVRCHALWQDPDSPLQREARSHLRTFLAYPDFDAAVPLKQRLHALDSLSIGLAKGVQGGAPSAGISVESLVFPGAKDLWRMLHSVENTPEARATFFAWQLELRLNTHIATSFDVDSLLPVVMPLKGESEMHPPGMGYIPSMEEIEAALDRIAGEQEEWSKALRSGLPGLLPELVSLVEGYAKPSFRDRGPRPAEGPSLEAPPALSERGAVALLPSP